MNHSRPEPSHDRWKDKWNKRCEQPDDDDLIEDTLIPEPLPTLLQPLHGDLITCFTTCNILKHRFWPLLSALLSIADCNYRHRTKCPAWNGLSCSTRISKMNYAYIRMIWRV